MARAREGAKVTDRVLENVVPQKNKFPSNPVAYTEEHLLSVMIANILCTDLDGPILNCVDRYYAVYRDNIEELGGIQISKEHFWEQKRNRINEMSILKQSNLGEKYYSQYRQMKISKIEKEQYLGMDFLQPEVHKALSFLKEKFDQVVLITLRRNKKNLYSQLRRLNLTQYFDHILTGFDEKIPLWEVKLNLFKENVPIKPREKVQGYFIGDTEVDILAGKKIGLKTVAVLSGIRTQSVLEKYEPDFIVQDLRGFLPLI